MYKIIMIDQAFFYDGYIQMGEVVATEETEEDAARTYWDYRRNDLKHQYVLIED